MDLNKIKNVHIIGIGGCASSAIAELLLNNNINVTGSELKKRAGLEYLENLGAEIYYSHKKENIDHKYDLVLFSPAVIALDPNNPEILETKKKNIQIMSWQKFIGNYLDSLGKKGITVSGSEGKGTTAGILTTILKDTEFDPLSILGAKIKKINKGSDSNIYFGNGSTYILEGDEFNRNFFNYHPSINIIISFQYEHPETYKDFDSYKSAFFDFLNGMKNEKKLILRATETLKDFANKYDLNNTHEIIWFGYEHELSNIKGDTYLISKQQIDIFGITFNVSNKDIDQKFKIKALPEYIVSNAVGAIIAAISLGLPIKKIKENILRFSGMVRRFDLYRAKNRGIFITDYGHSPKAIELIINEIKSIFKDKKIHVVFQPHLYSRTYNFFDDFIVSLKIADRISLIDIYPAREDPKEWNNKISSYMIYEKLQSIGKDTYYAGKSKDMKNTLLNKIDEKEITCFLGAGDMDQYYPEIFETFKAENYF